MPEWRAHGLLGFTINLQAGSPHGNSEGEPQPWINSAFNYAGDLRPNYMSRLAQILNRADEMGMVPIVGLFYFGQDRHLAHEMAVLRACDRVTEWLLDHRYANVLSEINNQADVADLGLTRLRYHHDVLRPARVHELVRRVQERSQRKVVNSIGCLLVGTSFCGLPPEPTIMVSDFILLHGNNLNGPDEVGRLVDLCRMSRAYTDNPVVFNEDDHTDFGASDNHLTAAISRCASWGYFDYRGKEDFGEGYQSMPTSWSVNTARKRAFFESIRQITGS
jgi:hypothetical protein